MHWNRVWANVPCTQSYETLDIRFVAMSPELMEIKGPSPNLASNVQ